MPETRFTILIDGQCPFCQREIDWLRRLDRRGALAFVDITEPDFDVEQYGLTRADVHAVIHGVSADGRVLRGMETFRRAYRAVGLGWVLAPTGWPILRPVFDRLYALFARYRVPMGRFFGGGGASTSCTLDDS